MILEIILLTLIAILSFFYLNGLYNESYWVKRGVKFYTKNRVIGPFWDFFTGKQALFEVFGNLYKEYENEPVVAVGALLSPTLFIRDPTNATHILQNEFNAFNHKGFDVADGDILAQSIPFLNGPKWKLLRQNMTPLFTTMKLKQMYYIMDKGAQDFVNYVKNDPVRQKGNAYDTLTNYCSATITASVFGIGTESIFDSPFVKIARQAIAPTIQLNYKFAIASLSAKLFNILNLKFFTEFEDFFIDAINQVIEKRKQENVQRHDFADIAVTLQKNGIMRDASTGCEVDPTVELLSAQAFFFFIAGVEPSATAFFCTLIELGVNPEVLQKVHNEIDEAFEKHDNDVSFDVVSGLNYLEKVLSESLRKYPPIGFVGRQCVQETVLPIGNITVPKGTKLILPIYQIHHDEKYYPNPEKFDPDRFTKDGQQSLSDTFYLPFGKGGRICMGARFARLQVKAGLVHILRQFTVKTINYDKMKFNKEPFSVRPVNVDVQFISRYIKK